VVYESSLQEGSHTNCQKSIYQIERDSPNDNVGVHVCLLIPGLMNS